MEYLVTTYQTIYADGSRDTVKPAQQIKTDDINALRMLLRAKHGCVNVNITYTELSNSTDSVL